jgi:hypothetical protein
MLGTPPVVRSRALLRLGSSRAFVCEGPDTVVRRFWWRRLEGGDYEVSHSISPYVPLAAYAPLVSIALGLFLLLLGIFFGSYTLLLNLLCASGYLASIIQQSCSPSGITTQRSSSGSCIGRS